MLDFHLATGRISRSGSLPFTCSYFLSIPAVGVIRHKAERYVVSRQQLNTFALFVIVVIFVEVRGVRGAGSGGTVWEDHVTRRMEATFAGPNLRAVYLTANEAEHPREMGMGLGLRGELLAGVLEERNVGGGVRGGWCRIK